MKTGAVIITAGRSNHADSFAPMIKVGSVSAIRRIIQTFQQAEVNPIVLVSSKSSAELRKHVSYTGIIFLENEADDSAEMIDYAKLGLKYLEDKCQQVLVTPVDIPLFTVDTVKTLIGAKAELANPSHKGRHGHPIIISKGLIPLFLNYKGENGLCGAIDHYGIKRTMVEVKDPGILFDIELDDDYEELLERHNSLNLHPEVRIQLVKEKAFFGPGAAQLLSLIEITGSVRLACQQMNVSYSKGWKMIKVMESQFGCQLINRMQGGKNGGGANLTAKGKECLDKYYSFESACKKAVQGLFDDYYLTS